MDYIRSLIQLFDYFLWTYIGIFFIVISGVYFSFQSGFAQIVGLPRSFKNFFSSFAQEGPTDARGTHPIFVFFASLGGCIGISNIVAISVAIQLGGPGALLWVWLAALLGMIIKYAEVYLGIKFRCENDSGSYDGGPMYFLRHAFPALPIIANIMALLMCVYGAEIYLFNIITESFVTNFSIPPLAVAAILLVLVLLTVFGGVRRVGIVNTWLIPVFMTVFLLMIGYVLVVNAHEIPALLGQVFRSAFTGQAALGGIGGSSLLITMSRGISSACYAADVGIGYASIIHAETSIKSAEKQASLAMVGIFLDTIIICTAVILLILISGAWQDSSLSGALLMQRALEGYFPKMHIFMPIFIFMLGFPSITAYLIAGIKAAKFLSPKYGKNVFIAASSLAFLFFSFYDSAFAMAVMYSCGGLLMLINIPGIFALRKHISYSF